VIPLHPTVPTTNTDLTGRSGLECPTYYYPHLGCQRAIDPHERRPQASLRGKHIRRHEKNEVCVIIGFESGGLQLAF
jgi:hypothetical protein